MSRQRSRERTRKTRTRAVYVCVSERKRELTSALDAFCTHKLVS